MKVILLQDVKSLGKQGDLVEVNNGYARNYILPKKLGVEATKKALNDLKLQKARDKKIADEQLAAAKDLARELNDKSISVSIKVGENGKSFGAISTKELAGAAKDQLGLELDKKKFVLDEAIKTVGTHVVRIRLHPKVTGELKVLVSPKQ